MCFRVASGLVWICLAGAAAADPPAPAVLLLTNDGTVAGEPLASDDPAVVRWRSPAFARPLEFPLSAVRGVHYPVPPVPPKPIGEYCFELTDDDVLYGDLIALTDDGVELLAPPLGRLHLKREQVRHVSRRDRGDLVYVGPTGLAGWTDPANRWREEGGELVTDVPGAYLFNDLGLPERSVVEVGLSWKGKPNFVLALGVDNRDGAARNAFRFEVWDDQVVVVGESARDADAAVVGPATAGGQIRVQVYLDQSQRRLALLSRAGKPLATLALDAAKPTPHGGVWLTNIKGDVRLDHLRVTRWAGPPPGEVRDDQSRVRRTDGTVVYGMLAAYDPDAKRFTVRDGETEAVVPHDAVADVYFIPPTVGEGPPAPEPPAVRVLGRDGSRVTGMPTRVEDTHLTLTRPGIQESLRLPLAGVRSLTPLRYAAAIGPAVAGRPGRLELEGVSLKGRLIDGEPPADGSLVWQPDLGRNPSPLLPGLSGRVVYRDPPARPAPVAPQANKPGGLIGVVAGVFRSGPAVPPSPRPAAGRRSLHLRTGDAIPCEVIRIDERGVTLKSPQSDATFVPNEKIKSVELIPTRDAPGLDEAKRDRLLTLPRTQKDSPPTHLICSKTGDFLRGRIVELDDARLRVEVRLETKDLPRDRVAQIIWLHPDELTDKKSAPDQPATRETRAQAVNADGNRLTFVVGKADGKTIAGTSDVLGACRAELADVDQVLFGTAIERSAAELAYHLWKLHHAAEPKFAQADAGGADGGVSGLDSPLVGQPAPAFQLDLLDGTIYKLADHKGKVVVLDFWATWCGPCLQSMPGVEELVREFADRGVELLAVNMEEPADQIKSVLERHKLTPPVALDRDGVVAAKYAVTAIPQTVVIDCDGKVARLFVGGGKATAEALRKSIQELLVK